MAATQIKKLSPVFWEVMIKMPPARLSRTLSAGLKRDPVWITDQALCAAKNIRLVSEEYGILTEFCHAHYSEISRQNLSIGVEAAIAGLDAIADNDGALNKACHNIVEIFEKMTCFDPAKALDKAAAAKASLGKAHPLYGALTELALDHLDDNDYDMFLHISQNASSMSAAGRDKFIDRVESLSGAVGSGIITVLGNFCTSCADLSDDPATERAIALLQYFVENPPVTVIYDAAPPKPKNYDVEGNVITLHPRRDPQ